MKKKVVVSVLTSAVMLLAAPLTAFAASIGDTDGSGGVDAMDASGLLFRAAEIGSGSLADADETAIMDINGDGQISALDASHLLTYAARIGTGEITQTFEEYVALRQEEPVLYGTRTKKCSLGSFYLSDEYELSHEKGIIISTPQEFAIFAEKARVSADMYTPEWFETHSLFVMMTNEMSYEPYYEATSITADENNAFTVALNYIYFPYESPACPDVITMVETNKAIEFASSITIEITGVLTDYDE